MDALTQKKVAEAKGHISDAEKAMKTSLFKRKPDLDSAASSYSSAATCFKIAKDHKNAIEYSRKAADCFAQNNSLFQSAKLYEQMALLANEIKDYGLVLDSIEKAADRMVISGNRDSAGIILERGGNMLKLNDPEKSLVLYKKAIHISDVEDKNFEMVKFYENAIGLSLRLSKYEDTISLINDSYAVLDKVGTSEQIVKYILTVIIIHLSKDDWVAAKSYLDNIKRKYEMASGATNFSQIDNLLDAYDEKDDERFKTSLKNFIAYAVDNEALKLAQKIVKSEEWLKHTRVEEKVKSNEVRPVETRQVKMDMPDDDPNSMSCNPTIDSYVAPVKEEMEDTSDNPVPPVPEKTGDDEEYEEGFL